MTTYVTLRTRINDELDESLSDATVNAAIQTAIKFYERKRFWFNEKTGTFATVGDQEYYGSLANSDIPNLVTIDSMVVTESSYKSPMYSATMEMIDACQNGSVTGLPKHFAYFNSQIRLYPIPDQVYTVTMAYQYRLTALSADADSNSWTTDAEALIRARAKWELCTHKLWNYDLADRLMLVESRELNELQAETRRRRSNRTLKVDLPSTPNFDIRYD